MNYPAIGLRTVDDLRKDSAGNARLFSVPAYQRGDRWTPLQVGQLLADIHEFSLLPQNLPEDYYCLQPLVLRRLDDERYEVVDGQQRLTTLMLILRHFNERQIERYRQTIFKIDYETRATLDDFFLQPSAELANSNADFYHISEAIETIETWFEEHENYVESFKTTLLNRTKVIWYELPNTEDPVEAFTRLNMGKVPLTEDELIRALFLKSRKSNPPSDAQQLQLRIAHEWDQIEEALQADDFWYFLNNKEPRGQNRIGFIFNLVTSRKHSRSSHVTDPHLDFDFYNNRLTESIADVESAWLEVKRTYMIVDEWFQDRELFHIIGFLIHVQTPVDRLLESANGITKSKFVSGLRELCWRNLFRDIDLSQLNNAQLRETLNNELDRLEYGSDSRKIRAVLLLFNLATLLSNRRSNIRFQFDSFKRESWDIEHIKAVASDPPEKLEKRRQWLNQCLKCLEDQPNLGTDELRASIRTFIDPTGTPSEESFETLYTSLLDVFGEVSDEDADHRLSNLTLLDGSTNRSYKNAIFAAKRRKILELDQIGVFIPTCTRNVFLKSYSPRASNLLFWDRSDREQYFDRVVDVLYQFFAGAISA